MPSASPSSSSTDYKFPNSLFGKFLSTLLGNGSFTSLNGTTNLNLSSQSLECQVSLSPLIASSAGFNPTNTLSKMFASLDGHLVALSFCNSSQLIFTRTAKGPRDHQNFISMLMNRHFLSKRLFHKSASNLSRPQPCEHFSHACYDILKDFH